MAGRIVLTELLINESELVQKSGSYLEILAEFYSANVW